MWVAMVTEPADQDQHNEQLNALIYRFPQYHFSIMMASPPYIICKAREDTVMSPDDEGNEVEMLRYMLTSLLDEHITGIHITDGLVRLEDLDR
jgi:hypothetical protein